MQSNWAFKRSYSSNRSPRPWKQLWEVLHSPQSPRETSKDNVSSETRNSHPEICFSLKPKCSRWPSLLPRVIAGWVRSGDLTHIRPIPLFFLGTYSWDQALQATLWRAWSWVYVKPRTGQERWAAEREEQSQWTKRGNPQAQERKGEGGSLGCWCPFSFWCLEAQQQLLSWVLLNNFHLPTKVSLSVSSRWSEFPLLILAPTPKKSSKALTNTGLICTVILAISLDFISMKSNTCICRMVKTALVIISNTSPGCWED